MEMETPRAVTQTLTETPRGVITMATLHAAPQMPMATPRLETAAAIQPVAAKMHMGTPLAVKGNVQKTELG
jgi:hypothetical protein